MQSKITADLLQARSEWSDIFQILKAKNCQPTEKKKLKEYASSIPALQRILKDFILIEKEK